MKFLSAFICFIVMLAFFAIQAAAGPWEVVDCNWGCLAKYRKCFLAGLSNCEDDQDRCERRCKIDFS